MPQIPDYRMQTRYRFLTTLSVFLILFAIALAAVVLKLIQMDMISIALVSGLTASGLGLLITAFLILRYSFRSDKESQKHIQAISNITGMAYWEYHFATNTFMPGNFAFTVPDFHPTLFKTPLNFIEQIIPASKRDVMNCLTSDTDTSESVIFQFDRADNDKIILECISNALFKNGNHIGRYGVIRDVTASRMRDESIRKKLAQTEKALHLSQMFEWEIDLESRQIHILSPFSAKLFLESGKQTFTFDEFFSRVDQQSRPLAIDRLTTRDVLNDSSLELRFNRIDGEVFYLRMHGTNEMDRSGQVTKRFGIAQDVSSLREAELALEESEKEKNLVVDNIPIGLALLTPERRLIWTNQKLYELFGKKSGKDDRNELCYRVLGLECDVCDNCPISEAIQQRRSVTHELDIENKTLSVSAVPFIDRYGEVTRVITVVYDISLQKQLREQLIHIHKMEAVAGLASGIAQDFNNAFQVIWNCVDGAMETCDESTQERLEPVTDVIKNGFNLVNQLLRFSGKETVLKPEQVDIKTFVKKFAEKLKPVIADNIVFNVSVDHDVRDILADVKILEDILMGVFENALEALPKGGKLELCLTNSVLPAEFLVHNKGISYREYICVTVSDNGMGIPQSDLNKVFNPYYTTKDSRVRRGSGLSGIYANMRRHHGYIKIDSTENQRTDVKLYFPVYATLDVDTRELLESISNTSDTDRVTILLVDDDPTIRKINRKTLEQRGYDVIEASDGQTAIDLFTIHAEAIHLVILDLVLPRRSGYEVYEYIMKSLPDMKVIFATGYSSEYLQKLPPDAMVMQKPISKSTLLDTVKLALIKHSQ
jgi:two-component system, cell cycle sensor histidine kinase and response regulator CckA